MLKKLVLLGSISLSSIALAQVPSAIAPSTTASAVKEESAQAMDSAAPAETAAPSDQAADKKTTTTTTTTTVAEKPTTMLTRSRASGYMGFGFSMPNVRGYTGLMPKLFMGYGSMVGSDKAHYMGIEVYGSAGSLPITHNQNNRLTYFYGLSLLPGVLLYETTLLVLRAGYQSTRYSKLENNQNGWIGGVALQTIFNKNWDIRFEYDYMYKNSLNLYNLDFVYKFC